MSESTEPTIPRAASRNLPGAVDLAVLTFVVVDVANARIYDTDFATLEGSAIGAVLLGLTALLWLRSARASFLSTKHARFLGIVPLLSALLSCQREGMMIGSVTATHALAAAGIVAILAGTLLGRVLPIALGALVTGLAVRSVQLSIVPIAPSVADPLPLVILGVRHLLHLESPYRMYHLPWDVPLTYLPLGWLPFAPLVALDVEPRWTNTFFDLVILGAIIFAARKGLRAPEAERDKRLPGQAAIALWSAWFVASRIVNHESVTAAPTQWAALAWLAALAVEKNKWTPAMFGVAAATTPFALPLLPTIAVAWHRAWIRPKSRRPHRPSSAAGNPARRFAIAAGTAAGVGAAIVLPFVFAAPHAFFAGVYIWLNDIDGYPRDAWNSFQAWTQHPGLAGIFWTLRAERLMKPIQLIVIVTLAITFARRTAAKGPRGRVGGQLVAVFMLFLLFNPMVWAYLWEPACCLGLVALASARLPSRP